MGNCGTITGKKIDLSKVPFDNLEIKLEGGTLQFVPREGIFVETENLNLGQNQPQNQHLNEDLDKARKDVAEKREKLKVLKNSIKDLEEKHANLMKILNVDFNEKEYIDKLMSKYEENKETLDVEHEVPLQSDEF